MLSKITFQKTIDRENFNLISYRVAKFTKPRSASILHLRVKRDERKLDKRRKELSKLLIQTERITAVRSESFLRHKLKREIKESQNQG